MLKQEKLREELRQLRFDKVFIENQIKKVAYGEDTSARVETLKSMRKREEELMQLLPNG